MLWLHTSLALKRIVRDRAVWALFAVTIFVLVLVPVVGSFSLRQVVPLSLTFVLACTSLFTTVVAILLGTSSLWLDIEKRYVNYVLVTPVTRECYLAGRFIAVSTVIVCCAAVLSSLGLLMVLISSPGLNVEISFTAFFAAVVGDCCKGVVVAALALLFSTVATSFYLPFFSSLVIYLCGSASQGVRDYLAGSHAHLSKVVIRAADILYYLLPNFSLFDFKVEAAYALPVDGGRFGVAVAYCCCYCALAIIGAMLALQRRQFA